HEVAAMCDAIVHRGPDDGAVHVGPGVGLGIRRLSIIDLETGRQPIANEDGSIHLVFNGEIYNYRELRRELSGLGHRFRTESDTETIVHLYEEHGPDYVSRLRGMFAFALWDDRRKRLLLARDRLGIKPLFYAAVGERLLFASELKAILQLPEVERELSWRAVSHLLSHLSTPIDESIIRGVKKLPPGHLLILDRYRAPVVERYWDVVFEADFNRSEEDLREELRSTLDEAVKLHLASDVPLGAFLSGGIDSSAVVATMARSSSAPVKTFSIGFSEPEFNELDKARLIARRFGTDHHEIVLEPNAVDVIDDLVWYLDEPFGDPSALPTYMVSRLASRHVKVVLSGDGGDELFAGYDKYVVERRERRFRFLPGAARRLLSLASAGMPEGMKGKNYLRHMSLDGWHRYVDAQLLFTLDEKRSLFHPDAFRNLARFRTTEYQQRCLWAADADWLSSIQYLDLHTYLPLDILTKVDRMSMAHSLEARVPLLDHRLVELAARIPPGLKLRGEVRKYLLKQAVKDDLPPEILDQKKQGFAVPLGRWFRGDLSSFVRDLLLSETSRKRGILNPAYIERLLQRHDRGKPLDFSLWTLLSFELWCRKFLDSPTRVSAESVYRPVEQSALRAAH
ncbi:MAG TPA: asparagine synthase (glutamine-hydrolyzing), partial [Vicinamibacteria bacterium]